MDYAIVIQRLPDDEGGGYLAHFPQLPGCAGDGDTPAEALADAERALLEMQDFVKAAKLPMPAPSPYRAPPTPGEEPQRAPSPAMLPSDSEALFEVHTIEGGAARAYRVYTDGRVSGFGQHAKLINRYDAHRNRDLAMINQAR